MGKHLSTQDKESIKNFEQNLKDNPYKLWNRMSSRNYFPTAVRVVKIAKKNGCQKVIGIPTVADRIAQIIVKMYFEDDE